LNKWATNAKEFKTHSLDEWLRHSSGLDIACNQWGSPCSLNSADQPAQLAQVGCNEGLAITFS
ncbi:hypothetical protein, partial [Inhella proteolytica]|uniref:hypothetical protein n=1 Tax=Inhella proteolytica TaxID=2795029 RepID=UPI001E581A84